MADKYTIGVDFGTESGRALVVRVRDGAEMGSAVHQYADGVIDAHLPGDQTPLPPEWALQNPDDYIARVSKRGAAGHQSQRNRCGGRDRDRDRFYGVYDDADARRRHAAVPSAGVAQQSARVGQAVETSRRPTRSRPDQRNGARARRRLAEPLRRENLVGVVFQQGAANSERSAGRVPRRRPHDRGGGLGDLAVVRRGDAQHLYGGLQGHLPGWHIPG